jgi:hypothetical protein
MRCCPTNEVGSVSDGNLEAGSRSVARMYHKSVTRLSKIKETAVYPRKAGHGAGKLATPSAQGMERTHRFLAGTKSFSRVGRAVTTCARTAASFSWVGRERERKGMLDAAQQCNKRTRNPFLDPNQQRPRRGASGGFSRWILLGADRTYGSRLGPERERAIKIHHIKCRFCHKWWVGGVQIMAEKGIQAARQ